MEWTYHKTVLYHRRVTAQKSIWPHIDFFLLEPKSVNIDKLIWK